MADLLDTIPYDLLETMQSLIGKRKQISDWCERLIEDIKTQEIAVNSAKTVGTAASVIGAILLFTPLAPAGIAALAGGGAAIVATSIGDYIATQVKDSSLKDEISSDKELADKLKEELEAANEVIERLMDQYDLTKDQATVIVFSSIKNGGQVIIAGVQIFQSVEQIREIAYLSKALVDLGKIGAFVEETTVALTAARVASGATKVLGVVGAILGVADVVYSWMSENPTRTSAERAKTEIDKSVSELERMKGAINNLK